MLMPAFHRFPEEAAIIGRILAGYGEVDFTLALCAARIHGDETTILRAIFRTRTESARVTLADTLLHPKIAKYKTLAGRYTHAIGGVRYCLKLRNQYAHCHWGDDDQGGLFFTNLEAAAEGQTGFQQIWLHVDAPLLKAQEEYFAFTMRCLRHIESEFFLVSGTRKRPHPHPMPKIMRQPSKHNPPKKHPPPWQDEAH